MFAGERFDAPLGQYHLRARYYDPRLGRFSGIDPALPDWSDPRSLNRYVYSFSDPINRRDPSGEFGLAEVMISVSINGILAQLAQPGVQPADAPILNLDFSDVEGYTDVSSRYSDTATIRTVATQTVRSDFSAYTVRVLNWGTVAHKTGLDAVNGLKDKTMHIIQNSLAFAKCDGLILGCAPKNGVNGHVFYQDTFNFISPKALKTQGRWRGNPNDGMGLVVGHVISHEAGHLYGLDHTQGIMAPAANLRAFTHGVSWDGPSKKRLQEVLGLKQP